MQLLDQRPLTLLVACALLVIYCWVESARQLHRSAQPTDDAAPSTFHSASWLLTFSPQAQAQGLDVSMVGFETARRALWVATSSPSSHDAAWLAGPGPAYWDKAETACASDPGLSECFVDLTSPNCRVRNVADISKRTNR